MHCREFTLPNFKRGETRRVFMTPTCAGLYPNDYRRRLDTQCVFLYKDKPITAVALRQAL
jgi:hypothetical protein